METMKDFLLYLFLFLMGCMAGYGLEVLFRRFVTAKKWVNPGFMKGPWLPLYGFGVVVMYALCHAFVSLLPDLPFYDPMASGRGPSVYDLIPIAVMGVGLNVLEFLAGIIFVKGFKVRLWDYTNMRGNIMGILCPLFTVIWFALAIIYYYLLHPFVDHLAVQAYSYMFGGDGVAANFGFIFAMGVGYGIFLIDLVQSIGLFAMVAKLAKGSPLLARYEELRATLREKKAEAGERFFSALPETVRAEIEKRKAATKEPSRFRKWLGKTLLIDPSKKDDATNNYDASGRPKKDA